MFRLILKMAWKNSFARPSRTLLLVVMIAVSMSMMLGIQGLYDGMAMNMADKNKRSDSGDISIFAKDYRINRDISYRIKNADEIRGELNNTPEVEAVVLRVSADGLASTARKSSFAQIRGIDLQEEENFGAFSEFLKQGKMEFGKRGAIVGIELAKTLKLKVGSKVVFSTQDSNGEINSMALKVDAIVQTTNIVLDTSAIYIDLEKLRTFLGLMSHEATQIVIKTENIKLYERLKSRYSSLDVKSFFELQPMMKMMEEMMVIFNSITFL